MIDATASNAPSKWNSIQPHIACLAPFLLIAAHAHAQFGAQPVGIPSATQTIQVTATNAGTVTRVEVLTLGSPDGDFTAGTGSSDCAAANLAIGATCTQSVVFTPAAPGMRMGAVVLVATTNGADVVLGVTYLSGTGTAESIAPVLRNTIRTTGQTGASGNLEDGDIATQTLRTDPSSTVLDGAGNMYIADAGQNRI